MNELMLCGDGGQFMVDECGRGGQERLLASRVLIVGAGGLGSPAAYYLASAGVGHIVLADDDQVELSNLQRQILHTTDRIGQAKAESGKQALLQLNPQIRIDAVVASLTGDALEQQVRPADQIGRAHV